MPGISHLEKISHSKGFRHPSLRTAGQVIDKTVSHSCAVPSQPTHARTLCLDESATQCSGLSFSKRWSCGPETLSKTRAKLSAEYSMLPSDDHTFIMDDTLPCRSSTGLTRGSPVLLSQMRIVPSPPDAVLSPEGEYATLFTSIDWSRSGPLRLLCYLIFE